MLRELVFYMVRTGAEDPAEEFALDARAGRLSAEELLRRYVTIVYSRTGSYEETARRLGLDRRTVKGKVDAGLLGRLRSGGGGPLGTFR